MSAAAPVRVYRAGLLLLNFAHNTPAEVILKDPEVAALPLARLREQGVDAVDAVNYAQGPVPGGKYDIIEPAHGAHTIGSLSQDSVLQQMQQRIAELETAAAASGRVLKQLLAHADCSICKMELEDLSKVKMLRCDHVFHEACILHWFRSQPFTRAQKPGQPKRRTCPNCRASHPPSPEQGPAAASAASAAAAAAQPLPIAGLFGPSDSSVSSRSGSLEQQLPSAGSALTPVTPASAESSQSSGHSYISSRLTEEERQVLEQIRQEMRLHAHAHAQAEEEEAKAHEQAHAAQSPENKESGH